MKATPKNIQTGLTVLDLFEASAPDAEAHWIKITPRGGFVARDGRAFTTPPEELVKRFNSDGVSIPVDVDHATVKKAAIGDSAPAVGWIEELQARPDGLYGRVAWLAEGRRILAARTHRYISPALKADERGRAIWLHSAALVAAPAISMPAVASAAATEKENSTMDLHPLTSLLGLAADADIEDILAAVISLKTGNQTKAPKVSAAFEGLAAGLSEELKRANADRRARKIEEAITLGAIPPSLRDWAIDLITVDEGRWDAFTAKFGSPLAYLRKSAFSEEQLEAFNASQARHRPASTGAAAEVARNLGIDAKALE
jgi:phage I-like protein